MIGVVLAVSFVFAVNVRADSITSVNEYQWYQNKDTYMNAVDVPKWTFGTFNQTSDNKSPREWEFTMTLNESVHSTGILTMSDYNGAGGLMQSPQGSNGTVTFWHTSAND